MKKTTIYIVLALLCLKKLKAKRPQLKACLPIALLLCLFERRDQRPKHKDLLSKSTIIICSMLLLFCSATMAQGPIKPLKVGDKLPEAFWQQEHSIYANGNTSKETLEKYKGQLLILDFWATWCGSCINKFRTIEELQSQFAVEANFLLVNTKSTRDDEKKIDDLLSGRKYETEPYTLTTLFNDTYIHQLFPYGFMPYYVVISPNAEVRAILPAELITAENVRLLLERYGAKTKKGAKRG